MSQQNIRYNSSLLDAIISTAELEQYNDAIAASETLLQKKNALWQTTTRKKAFSRRFNTTP